MQQLRRFDRALLADAILMAGSSAKLARACGVSTSAITNAKMRGTISPELALAVHKATNGEVSASALRPDLWPRHEHVPVSGSERRTRRAKRHRNGG